ncbi:serine/threonine-protein kinase HipA [Pseudomonas cuatrocienegasensis]|uniref:Serine/threonine-protein kinase HipA n=1 Tax=Pseudomonas cuatrocienegasensis TaxID=543360 RepID=A0ABY1BI21_9PSED|nr:MULTISPECIES: HipA domain-containing protein [Pseudomonas]OEC34540.1 toxin HipA [Pseudomonas sp. 21C1]SEQ91056.1 serine/threonine-protein kinase HipA [Pseudomonas cuatrocienegasensis]
MESITLQAHLDGQWRDAMLVRFDEPQHGLRSRCSASYVTEYLAGLIAQMGSVTAPAISADFPLSWDVRRDLAPAFLHDIIPAGAARRHILARMAVPLDSIEEFFLLQRCCAAPIGHLRVKESVDGILAQGEVIGFPREEVIRRDTHFLDYAHERGAAIGGATGAGGEAPKLLLVEDGDGHLYPDAVLPDAQVRRHWFIKFPRNAAGATDRNILHSEYCYYRALGQLGIDTIASDGLAYEVAEKPSLWMPRFDRQVTPHGVERTAVESIYSLCGVTRAGSRMDHLAVVDRLADTWAAAGQADEIPAMVSEYLRRDLINQILGNTDNHGRNLSILRTHERIRFAPIYDLAPMVMDPEGIVRTSKWPAAIERLNTVDWQAACARLAHRAEPEWLLARLHEDAQLLRALPDLLTDLGLPQETWKAPAIVLNRLDETLRRWGLM